MNISIIGLGFVGNAIKESFLRKNINVFTYDINKKSDTFEECLNSKYMFLCLPTLFENNCYNKDAIINTCDKISNYNGIIIIKSTVEPSTTQFLGTCYKDLKFIHNPDFLTTRTSFEDFHNQTHIVLGLNNNITFDDTSNLKSFWNNNYPNTEISICSSIESETMKMFCNSFYASKIMIFNEYYLLCQKLNIDYNTVKNLMLKNNWINPQHTNVPGPDGKLAFGGACFPKDTKALLQFMKQHNSNHNILQSIVNESEIIRNLK
jgi:UDPglucose 6-dehydrogenase